VLIAEESKNSVTAKLHEGKRKKQAIVCRSTISLQYLKNLKRENRVQHIAMSDIAALDGPTRSTGSKHFHFQDCSTASNPIQDQDPL